MHQAHILGRISFTITKVCCVAALAVALTPNAHASPITSPLSLGSDYQKGPAPFYPDAAMAPMQDPSWRTYLGRKGGYSGGTVYPATVIPLQWRAWIGPKGGLTRKGLY